MTSASQRESSPNSSGSPSKITLRAFITRLIWLSILPPLALAVWLAIDSVQRQQQEFMNDARVIAQNFAVAIDNRLQARINGLTMLALSPLIDDAERWPELFREAQGFQQSFGSHVVFATAAEPIQMLFNTRVAYGKKLPALPRPKGQAAAPQAAATGLPAVGDIVAGPIVGKYLVAIAVPVIRHGKPAYVMLTPIEVEQFQKRLDQLEIPRNWAMSLVDGQGKAIARHLPSGMNPDRDVDASGRITVRVPQTQWSVVLEIPRHAFNTPLFSATAKLLGGLVAALLVGILVGKVAGRRLVGDIEMLLRTTASDAPPSDIIEIAAVSDQLKATAAQRKADNEALLASELRFAATFDHAAVGIAIVDPDGRWLRVNRKLAAILGYPPDELLTRTFQEITHPDDLDRDLEQVGRMLNREIETYSIEKRYLHKDGTQVWVNLTVALVWTAQGKPDYFISVVEDIALRKQAQEEMQTTKAKLEAALASMSDAVVIADAYGRFIEFNDAFATFHKFKSKEDCAPTLAEYPELLEVYATTGELLLLDQWPGSRALRGETATNAEFKLRRKDTGETWVGSYSFAPIRDQHGEIAGSVVAGRDITEQRAAEAAVRESENRLRLALEAAKAGNWELDLRKNRSTWSNEVFQLYGLQPGSCEPSHQAWLDSIHPDDRDAVANAVVTAERLVTELNVEWRVNDPAGSERWLMSRGKPELDAEGQAVRYRGIVMDISERKTAELELEQHRNHLATLVASRTAELAIAKTQAEAANLSKTAFLANMSHEIRTPMNAIIGLTHLIRRSGPTPQQSERLDKIDSAGKHLLSIINDILDISKIEAGRMELEYTDFHLSAILDNIRSLIGAQAQSKGLAIEIDPDSVPDWLRGDPTRLRQALLNYAGNAVKFTERGTITLRAILLEGQGSAGQLLIRFEVQDTGIGIAADKVASLFQAFEQADVSITRRYGGTGLGLAITRRLAGLMGGEAGVDSTFGVGSTFWFTVRLTRGHGVRPALPVPAESDVETQLRRLNGSPRILLAEDNEINREVALELLHSVNLNADTAADGVEAVAKVRERQYDLIFMDMQMPRMDGLEATRQIRALPSNSQTPIIAMTANAFGEDRERCMNAGMDDFVTKPVDPGVLYALLLKWLKIQ